MSDATYRKNSRAKSMAAASPGMFSAVSSIRTVTRLAPVTAGMARAAIHVSKLPAKIYQDFIFKHTSRYIVSHSFYLSKCTMAGSLVTSI